MILAEAGEPGLPLEARGSLAMQASIELRVIRPDRVSPSWTRRVAETIRP